MKQKYRKVSSEYQRAWNFGFHTCQGKNVNQEGFFRKKWIWFWCQNTIANFFQSSLNTLLTYVLFFTNTNQYWSCWTYEVYLAKRNLVRSHTRLTNNRTGVNSMVWDTLESTFSQTLPYCMSLYFKPKTLDKNQHITKLIRLIQL